MRAGNIDDISSNDKRDDMSASDKVGTSSSSEERGCSCGIKPSLEFTCGNSRSRKTLG